MAIMLPTLRAERQATYSPVLPISPRSGIVLQVPVEVVNAEAGLIRFEDPGEVIEHCILSGGAKLPRQVDRAMRWVALYVDHEMYGKDLTDRGIQTRKLAKPLSGRTPEPLTSQPILDTQAQETSRA